MADRGYLACLCEILARQLYSRDCKNLQVMVAKIRAIRVKVDHAVLGVSPWVAEEIPWIPTILKRRIRDLLLHRAFFREGIRIDFYFC